MSTRVERPGGNRNRLGGPAQLVGAAYCWGVGGKKPSVGGVLQNWGV